MACIAADPQADKQSDKGEESAEEQEDEGLASSPSKHAADEPSAYGKDVVATLGLDSFPARLYAAEGFE